MGSYINFQSAKLRKELGIQVDGGMLAHSESAGGKLVVKKRAHDRKMFYVQMQTSKFSALRNFARI